MAEEKLYGKQQMVKDEYETHLHGILWYWDSSCGCSECDEVYNGRGMIQKLKSHAKKQHQATIKVDGYSVFSNVIA